LETTAKTFQSEDQRPLKLIFQDEARFGRMQNPVKCWVPRGVRPHVALQRVREYMYVYSAVCPVDGDSYSLILPWTNTDMMELFLGYCSEYYKDYRVIMIMDGASWHKSKRFNKFENIRIISLPPYSPELNPTEHLWEHIREKYLGNRFWETMEILIDTLYKALLDIVANKEIVKSLTGFHWAII